MHEFQDVRWQRTDIGPQTSGFTRPVVYWLIITLSVPGYKMLLILRDLFNPVFPINSVILSPQFCRRQDFQEHAYGIIVKVPIQKYFIQIKNLLITLFYNHSPLFSNLSSSEKAS